MGFNHNKKNYSAKTGVVFKIAGKIPLPPVPGGLIKISLILSREIYMKTSLDLTKLHAKNCEKS